VFELQDFKDTYSFPMEVVELNKKSFEMVYQDACEREDKMDML
jgi:hypothetical protein